MAFNGAFTVSPVAGSNSQFVITDTSTGSDSNLTGRTIYLYKIDGTLLGGSAISWPTAAGSTKTINLLDRDYALSIVVQWASSSPLPSPSSYSYTVVHAFNNYTQSFVYGLQEQISANPNFLRSPNYSDALASLYNEIDNSENAADYDNQFSAQSALDRAYAIMQKQNLYFS